MRYCVRSRSAWCAAMWHEGGAERNGMLKRGVVESLSLEVSVSLSIRAEWARMNENTGRSRRACHGRE